MKWLESFDLFVLTSKLEGIPRCLMESLAMGVPSVAYNIPGVDQLIVNNETGLLCEFGDKETLLKHWKSALYDTALATKLATNGREYIYARYSAQRMSNEYASLFEKMSEESL